MSDPAKTAKGGKTANPGKGNNAAKAAAGGQPKSDKPGKRQAQRVPLLVETALTLSQLGLILTGAGVFWVSLQAGADFTAAALRSGAAVLVVGLVLWLANWLLARGALDAVAVQMREAAEAQAEAHGTLDVNA